MGRIKFFLSEAFRSLWRNYFMTIAAVVTVFLSMFLLGIIGQLASGVLHVAGAAWAANTLHEIFIIISGLALIRLLGLVLFRVLLPLVRIMPPRILEDIVLSVAYIGWGLVRLRYAGVDLTGILATSAVITAVVAFAMQDTLGNILGGVALQLDDSIKIGDWIKVGDITGKVVDIRWRSTTVETRNWETVVIPNSLLMKGTFSVLGRRAGAPLQWRRWVWFNVPFDIPPARVLQTVETALRDADIPRVSRQPPPSCALMDFESGYARYALRYWLTDLAVDDPTDSSVRTHIYAALQRAGISLAVSAHSLHVTKEGEKYEQAVRSRELAERLQAIRAVELFRDLTEDEQRAVAERLIYAPFASGEVMTRQGAVAHWLYILTDGEAEVYLETPGRDRSLLYTVNAGSFFGEMGLMTGAPRAATVVAKTDVECYRLDKTGFADILKSRPAIAEAISAILAQRQAALETARQAISANAPDATTTSESREILARIRRFFGLG